MRHRFDNIAFNSTAKKKPTESDKNTYLGLEHLDSGSLTVTRFGTEVAPIGEKLLMNKGDVLFGKRRAYQKKVAVAPFDGIFSAHGMVLRPKTDVVTEKFFPLFIASDYFLDEAIKISVGSLSPTINWSALKELEFNLPSLEEQDSLAEVLWAMIEAKTAYKRLLSLTDDLVKSQFVEMFGDPVTNPKGWEVSPLGNHADVLTGNPFNSDEYVEDGIRICGGLIIMPDRVAWEDAKHWKSSDGIEKYLLEVSDIVLAMDRPWIGSGFKIAQIQQHDLPALLIQRTARIRCSDVHSTFLMWMLNNPNFRLHCKVTETTVPHISIGDIREYEILTPPFDLQHRFAAFAKAADKSKFVTLKLTQTAAQVVIMISKSLFGALEYRKTQHEQGERHYV